MNKPTVCIVGVYFGKFPDYFDLWLRSAAFNSSVDFMIFTDAPTRKLPENVHFFPMSFQEIIRRGQDKMGIEIALQRPYKCCDLKPAYGLLFDDYLQGYDYWGHCDFDLIWGDLRFFFERYCLEKYDKFLPLGHLCLYRNTVENNKRFMLHVDKGKNYKAAFTTQRNCAFDETSVPNIFSKYAFPTFEKRIFADISKIYKRYRLALDDINYDRQVFYWKKGKIFRTYQSEDELKEEEFVYIHFKERGNLSFEEGCLFSPLFFITNTGFYEGKMEVNLTDIEKYNPFLGADFEMDELRKFRLAERCGLWKNGLSRVFLIKDQLR